MADHSKEIAELMARAKALQAKHDQRYDDLKPLDAARRQLSRELAAAKAGVEAADKEVSASLKRAMEEDKFAQDLDQQAHAAEVKGDEFEATQIRQQAADVRNDAERFQHVAREARENADEYRAKVARLTEQHEVANDAYSDLHYGLDRASSGVNRLEYVARDLGDYDKHTNAAEGHLRVAAEERAKGNLKEAKAHEASAAKETAAAAKAEKQVEVQRSYFDEAEKSFEILEQPVAVTTPIPPGAPAGTEALADAAAEDDITGAALVNGGTAVAAAGPTAGLAGSDDTDASWVDSGSSGSGSFADVAGLDGEPDTAARTFADVDATPPEADLGAMDGSTGDSFESDRFAAADGGIDDSDTAGMTDPADTYDV